MAFFSPFFTIVSALFLILSNLHHPVFNDYYQPNKNSISVSFINQKDYQEPSSQ
jgi:hypothetical protein